VGVVLCESRGANLLCVHKRAIGSFLKPEETRGPLKYLDDDLDPDPECGSGYGSRSKEIAHNLQINLIPAFQKGFCAFVGRILFM
jgi:hypothetical protein